MSQTQYNGKTIEIVRVKRGFMFKILPDGSFSQPYHTEDAALAAAKKEVDKRQHTVTLEVQSSRHITSNTLK